MSTRELAAEVGISNGSAYYVVAALLDKGLIKLGNFANNQHKSKYVYLLTPKGMSEKSLLTYRFIKHKRQEFEALKAEIQTLEAEAGTGSEVFRSAEKNK